MIIREIKYSPFSYKFKIPFQTSTGIISERKGFLISLRDELGNDSLGECSPLPGFSHETFDDVEKFLSTVNNLLIGSEIDSNLESIRKSVSNLTNLPSVQFAVEQAEIGLILRRNQHFFQNNFDGCKNAVPVNAVIGFDKPENVLVRAEKKYKAGYSNFKIKVGRENFSEDYEIVKMIRKHFREKITIRLDANGKWNIDEAVDNLSKLSEFEIEYIEEPCGNLACLMKLADNSPIPIAVDESLTTYESAKNILQNSKIYFLVLKPMILGGVINSIRLIKQAEILGKKIIISSTFETCIGKSALVFLASLTAHNLAHGLDTTDFFELKSMHDPFPVQNGNIIFESKKFPSQFKQEKL